MAVVTFPVRIKSSGSGLRPMDPTRDFAEVVKLIEIGFQEELDPAGWKMLHQMRQMASRGLWAQILHGSMIRLQGFVWTERSRVVGTLSLRRSSPGWRAGWLIGNVVVHPDYRGQGIGNALMERAIETATAGGGRWLGLEVRADNAVARGLYQRLGFAEVGQTAHLLRSAQIPLPEFPEPGGAWRSSQSEDSSLWMNLVNHIYASEQKEVMELRPGLYDFGGWERKVDLWLRRQRESAWIHDVEFPRRAVHVRVDRRYHFHEWELLCDPEEDSRGAEETTARALSLLRHDPGWPVVTFVTLKSPLRSVLEAIDFHEHRRLVQMQLPLT